VHLTGYFSNSKNWNRLAIGLLRCMYIVTHKYTDLHKLLSFLVAPPPTVWGKKAIQKMCSRSISFSCDKLCMVLHGFVLLQQIEMLNFNLLISPLDLMIFLAFNISYEVWICKKNCKILIHSLLSHLCISTAGPVKRICQCSLLLIERGIDGSGVTHLTPKCDKHDRIKGKLVRI
jgi:hypothetical protein